VQHYNFAVVPEVQQQDAFWHMKKQKQGLTLKKEELREIHMPSNSGLPIISSAVFGVVGFLLVFEWHLAAAVGAVGIIIGLIVRSFDYNDGHHVHIEEVEQTEQAWRQGKGEVHDYVG
jgi:cytochrome aa3-600 menaquinol oxidase subunit 1